VDAGAEVGGAVYERDGMGVTSLDGATEAVGGAAVATG